MKKVVKKTSVLLFALILVVCMALPVSAASISKKKVTICTGQTIQLKVNGIKKKARWTSSNKAVATVTQNGKVSAKKKGTTTVTAKIGKKKYTCKVAVESPKLSKASITVKKGKTYQLKMRNTKQKYKWYSKNKSIATVTSKGKVTGKKNGTTYICAKSASGKTFKCKVTVKKVAKKVASSNNSFSNNSFFDGSSSNSSGSNGSNSSTISNPTIKTYGLGQTWRVNGQFEFTINRVYETDYRNPYDETNPAQVIMIEYTCKNIGYTNNDSFMPGLWMTIDNCGKVIDQSGYVAETYPGNINHYYQELPIGASCVAESCYGLRNRSQRIKLQMDMYLVGMWTEQAIFDLPVY